MKILPLCNNNCFLKQSPGGVIAHQVRVIAAKYASLRMMLRSSMVEGESDSQELSFDLHTHMMAHTHQTNGMNKTQNTSCALSSLSGISVVALMPQYD